MAMFAVPETLCCFWSTKRRVKFGKWGIGEIAFLKQHVRWANVPCLNIINPSPAYIRWHRNLKRNPCNCKANIYFNKKCIRNKIVPKFAKIIIPNTSPASKFTQHKTSALRLRNGIRYPKFKNGMLCLKIEGGLTLFRFYFSRSVTFTFTDDRCLPPCRLVQMNKSTV